MTDINFYVSNQEGIEHRLNIVYKLISHALKRQLFIHIHTDNEQMNKQVDDWLWTKEKHSFIPHSIIIQAETIDDDSNAIATDENAKEAITISHDYEPMEKCDYLINLSRQRPSFFSRYLKLAEILDNNEEIITAGRKRYAFYRERGYNLAYHKL